MATLPMATGSQVLAAASFLTYSASSTAPPPATPRTTMLTSVSTPAHPRSGVAPSPAPTTPAATVSATSIHLLACPSSTPDPGCAALSAWTAGACSSTDKNAQKQTKLVRHVVIGSGGDNLV